MYRAVALLRRRPIGERPASGLRSPHPRWPSNPGSSTVFKNRDWFVLGIVEGGSPSHGLQPLRRSGLHAEPPWKLSRNRCTWCRDAEASRSTDPCSSSLRSISCQGCGSRRGQALPAQPAPDRSRARKSSNHTSWWLSETAAHRRQLRNRGERVVAIDLDAACGCRGAHAGVPVLKDATNAKILRSPALTAPSDRCGNRNNSTNLEISLRANDLGARTAGCPAGAPPAGFEIPSPITSVPHWLYAGRGETLQHQRQLRSLLYRSPALAREEPLRFRPSQMKLGETGEAIVEQGSTASPCPASCRILVVDESVGPLELGETRLPGFAVAPSDVDRR